MNASDMNDHDREPTSSQATMGRVAYERSISRQAAEKKERDEAAREAYRTPLLMFAIGAAGVCTILAFNNGFAAVGIYLLSFIASVPIGLGVYLLCCAIWIGFNEPIHLIALNLAGIYAITDLISTGIDLIPFSIPLIWLLPLVFYVSLLAKRLEIEFNDAIIVGLITYLVKFFIFIAIMTAMM